MGDNTSVDLFGSWIDAEYARISPLVLQNPNFIRNPDGPPGIPQYKYSVGVQHAFNMTSGATLTGRVDYNYEDDRASNVTNLMGTPSFDIVNLSLTWLSQDRGWELSGALNNALDQYYFNNLFDISGFAAGRRRSPRPA